MIVKEYMLFPGKIENWNIMVDFNSKKGFQIPHKFSSFADHFMSHFPNYVENIFVINPSNSFVSLWNSYADQIYDDPDQ